jgi:phosphoribosylaminoimidazolecarboxamide formyltransferase/IMP cyclohydrolase
MSTRLKISRALISVSDKSNLDSIANYLYDQGVEIISSGGTRKYLENIGIQSTPIEEVTGNPEAFGGRMKTLSFNISSSLLYRRGHNEDEKTCLELGIKPIDLVICNLYPFESVAKNFENLDELIENIDIGGPTMLRAAAKNFSSVVCLSSIKDYEWVLKELKDNSCSLEFDSRKKLAARTFSLTSRYEQDISSTLDSLLLDNKDKLPLRYGENPHQQAFFEGDINLWKTIQGKELSYNNILDSDASIRCLADLDNSFSKKSCCVIVKHSNPCGASVSNSQLESIKEAWSCDPISSFGSIITFNEELQEETAVWLSSKFVEVIIAPSFSEKAIAEFSKKKNLRLVALPNNISELSSKTSRSVIGGNLVQEEDSKFFKNLECPTESKLDTASDVLLFGAIVTKHFRSNAISLVSEVDNSLKIIGAGMGNPNRLISTEQAIAKARENGFNDFSNCVLISDAFFPFRDNIDLANKAGISCILQPGGSIKDNEVISACNEHGISMGFTGLRHFRH